MARIDRFMIAPINTGLQTDLKPWLIPDDAFAQLTNAYVFRGRVRKRFGSYLMNQGVDAEVAQLYSRVRVNVGTTDGAGNFGPTVMPGATGAIGQLFSVEDTIFTAYQANGATLTTGVATATYNTGTRTLQIVGNGENPNTDVYFYPATPIMGLITYESGIINDEPVFAFDTQFAYEFNGISWERLGTAVWTGSDSQFFWGSTYIGIFNSDYYLFVTNFNTTDRQKYWDGSAWNQFSPILGGTFRLLTSRIVVPFKDRLICLNTVENDEGQLVGTTDVVTGNFTGSISGAPVTSVNDQKFLVGTTVYSVLSVAAGAQPLGVEVINPDITPPSATFNASTGQIIITGNNNNPNQPVYWLPNTGGTSFSYVNRCRFSQNGSPVNSNAWAATIPGKGGYIDAPTKEQIVTADFLKDRLIVYFERSTWELVYTGNEILPFRWQQINTELGVESTFSVVPFDKVVLGVGNVGVHACNGGNVDRIDQKIPDSVFEISNDNQGVFRVYGIRDYFAEMVYWTFPSEDGDATYPNRVLVFNYKTGSWAFNTDSITAFGYYQKQDDITWATNGQTWEQSVEVWNSGVLQSQFRQIIGGNQEGFIFIVDVESSRNAPGLQITNMTASGILVTITAINHNLVADEFVVIENAQGVTGVNNNIYKVYSIINDNSFTVASTFGGTYTGGGTVARVSNIDIYTKQYNFYVQDGRNAYVSKVDFYVDKTDNGQITVDSFVSSSTESQLTDGTATGALLGTGILETSPYTLVPLEQTQARIWHPVYLQAEGECIQLRLYMSDDQITEPNIAWSDFELHSFCFYTQPTASRLQ